MLTCASSTVLNGSLDHVVDQLVYEERDSGPIERRSAHRQPFMRPVTIVSRRTNVPSIQAFSKNISAGGVGLVTPASMEIGTISKLAIHRTAGPPVYILAECRWCDRFGDGWFIHGWNFINLARPD